MLVFAAVDLAGASSALSAGSGSVTDAAVRAWGEIVDCAQRGHGLAVATAAAQGAFTVRDRLQTEPRLAATLASAEVASAAFAFALNRDGDFEVARRVAAVTLTELASDLPRAMRAPGDAVYWID